jgi:predicted DNA-binding protein
MVTLPEYLEKKLIVLAHRKQVTTDKILEWALKSLECDFNDTDLAEETISDIATGKEQTVSLSEYTHGVV